MGHVPFNRSQEDQLSGPLTGRFRHRIAMEPMDPQTDRLVRRAVKCARNGDEDAVRFLYVRFSENVYGFVRSILHDDHEAEDVTQQVFMKLMTSLGSYRERDVPFTAWIMRVARNAAVDHLRSRRAIPAEEVRAADEFEEDSHERLTCLREALDDLPQDQHNVLILRHVVGLSPGEIADVLGKSASSIHGLHHRGRGTLQRSLDDFGLAPATLDR
jgi:RNA polymerase sigma-70 factor (ECF subfamily)